MSPIEYLKSLIAGMEVSSIPIQQSELIFLLQMLESESYAKQS